jgi:hypothetical protein
MIKHQNSQQRSGLIHITGVCSTGIITIAKEKPVPVPLLPAEIPRILHRDLTCSVCGENLAYNCLSFDTVLNSNVRKYELRSGLTFIMEKG